MRNLFVDSVGRRARGGLAVFALAIGTGAIAPSSECRADEPQILSFDVELAPICLDGIYPMQITTPSGKVNADLHVNTDVRGRLHGFVDLDGVGLSISGTAKRVAGAVHVAFKAVSGRDRITFTGDVADGSATLSGTASSKGVFAQGATSFTANLTGAKPVLATIEFAMTQTSKGAIKGKGHVLACGTEVPLTAKGKTGSKGLSLTLTQGSVFKFAGTGPAGGTDFVVDWTAKGFGGSGAGAALLLIPVSPPQPLTYPSVNGEFELDTPIPAIIPKTGDAPRGKFTVSPLLPAGLSLDAANGRITGTPSAAVPGQTYTVTAANYAGSSSASFAFSTRIPRARSFAPETRFLTDGDLKHFLSRAEFGIRQVGGGKTSLDSVRTAGFDSYLNTILVFRKTGPAEAIAAPELGGNSPTQAQLASWWSSLLMNSDDPFQERLAFFWADLFAVSSDNLEANETHLMKDYVNLYRYEGNGNLRTLLLKMARSGAMLKYLNGNVNTAANPNENFAREFWELFTLGVDKGYTQADIVQASRAWTGWKFVTDGSGRATAVFDPALHDTGTKSVLGQTIGGQSATDDYQAMVDLTLDHAPVAEHIVTKLFEHFGFETPHPDLVAAMAANLRQNNYELTPFLRALFKSEAFFSAAARGALIKNPLEYTVGFIHLTGLKITPVSLQSQLTTLGQSPTEPPTVNGWPQGKMWFSGQNLADRANFLDAVIADTARQSSVGINVANILPPPGQRSSAEVVDWLAAMFGLTLRADERLTCIGYLDNGGTFDGTSQTQIDKKVRGLLCILAQHPSYEIR